MSASTGNAPRGYETSDTKGRSIFIGMAIIAVTIAITVIGLNELFVITTFKTQQEQVAMVKDPKLGENRATAMGHISGYKWVDEEAGVVQIPVERAMELMAEEAYQASR